jgi:hypothetical protein
MILALALLTITQLSPETTSARLLAPETVGMSGGPAVRREVIPGVKPAWMPMVVAGGITLTAATVSLVAMVALRVGGWAAVAVAVFGGLISIGVHVVCAIISIVIGAENRSLREAHERRRRDSLPAPVSAAPLQPTAVVFRF